MFPLAKITGIAFVDSTALAMFRNKRITRTRIFESRAKISLPIVWWRFFGVMVRLISFTRGRLLGIRVTTDKVNDHYSVRNTFRTPVSKKFGDKVYMSTHLADVLDHQGVRLVTSLRKNMTERRQPLWDKLLFRKRSLIEMAIDPLKKISQFQQTHDRRRTNLMVNVLADPRHPRIAP